MMKKAVAVAVLLLLVAVIYPNRPVLAQDESAPEGIAVKVKGTSIDLLATFANDAKEDADAAYVNMNALKVSDIDVDALESLKGKVLFVLPTAAATPMLTGKTTGKECEITGQYFKAANVILIEELICEGLEDDEFIEMTPGQGSGMPVL